MSDVFLSYAREDQAVAAALARSLHAEGYQVWFDRQIQPHQAFADVIDQKIREARCVLVLWSKTARSSAWVRSEASTALDLRKLVQCRLDPSAPPRPFDQIQLADLSGWRGELAHPGRQGLSQSLRFFAGPRQPAGATPVPLRAERRGGLGAIVVTGLVCAGLGAAGGYLVGAEPLKVSLVEQGGQRSLMVTWTVDPDAVAAVQPDVDQMVADNPELF